MTVLVFATLFALRLSLFPHVYFIRCSPNSSSRLIWSRFCLQHYPIAHLVGRLTWSANWPPSTVLSNCSCESAAARQQKRRQQRSRQQGLSSYRLFDCSSNRTTPKAWTSADYAFAGRRFSSKRLISFELSAPSMPPPPPLYPDGLKMVAGARASCTRRHVSECCKNCASQVQSTVPCIPSDTRRQQIFSYTISHEANLRPMRCTL